VNKTENTRSCKIRGVDNTSQQQHRTFSRLDDLPPGSGRLQMYILKEKTAAVSAMKAVACVGSHKNKRYDAAAAGGWGFYVARVKSLQL